MLDPLACFPIRATRKTGTLTTAARAARIKAVADWFGLWISRGRNGGASALRDAALLNGVATRTVERWAVWALAEDAEDTDCVRYMDYLIHGRRPTTCAAGAR